MRKLWETGILLFAVAGFWGMIYPDLCFISDVCQVETAKAAEDGGQEEEGKREEKRSGGESADADAQTPESRAGEGGGAGADIYTRLCEAEPGQIRVKSKLLEIFCNNGK